MTTPPVRVERRVGQRFSFNLPVTLRDVAAGTEGVGFTQDVSSRGVFFFTDMPVSPSSDIELTVKMPSEITLGESMRVRCKARVLRVVGPAARGLTSPAPIVGESRVQNNEGSTTITNVLSHETKIGVAVCLSEYEYLPASEDEARDFRRISALHSVASSEQPAPTADLTARAAD